MSASVAAMVMEQVDQSVRSTFIDTTSFEDESPFGLQGLMRETLQILQPDCVTKLAITLALRGTSRQIKDTEFVKRELSFHQQWIEEYQVVHLIEKSLWIQGHSDLVMTMTRNPAQIPDNPPPRIMEALTRACGLHPTSTVWYCVPLFGDEKNEEGLPIPVTASQVRDEAARRIQAAQQHALRWGWLYRAIFKLMRMPSLMWRTTKSAGRQINRVIGGINAYFERARRDARRRRRAEIKAELERVRDGFSQTTIPEHTTWLGSSLDSASKAADMIAFPEVAAGAAPLGIVAFSPIMFIPMTIISVDPFLFVELPEEPGKLRHLGHWYWQSQPAGKKKLHLHV